MKKDVIIACDFPDGAQALAFLARFPETEKPLVKIGMELFYGEGPDIVRQIKGMGHRVFLDLKLHDIPNTVQRAMRGLARLGVDMTNLHAAGGITMMRAAREGLAEGGAEAAALIAVTQLTSTSEEAMRRELWIDRPLMDTVIHYAENAKEAGLAGVVCSPLEARAVKDACGGSFLAVTPGIRYPSGDTQDQVRVTSPAAAREIGADFIVVGRPITGAEDPVAAWEQGCSAFIG